MFFSTHHLGAVYRKNNGTHPPVMIREFRIEDVEGVCELHKEMFADSSISLDLRLLGDFYREVFLESPFCNPEAPSLVVLEGRRVQGFVGVLSREFDFLGETLRIGVGSRFMVNPSANGLVGASLLRKASRSGIDLFFTDGANEFGGATMKALGGVEVPLLCLQWFKVIRPFGFLSNYIRKRASLLGRACSFLSLPFDGVVGRFLRARGGIEEEGIIEDLNLEEAAALYQGAASLYSMTPLYQPGELAWLFRFCSKMKTRGSFYTKKVGFKGEALGGFAAFLRPNGVFEVLNLWAPKHHLPQLFVSLFHFASQLGATAVQGRLDHVLFDPLRKEKVIFKHGSWVFVNGKNRAAIQAIQTGNALIGGLEGELWLPSARFGHP